MAKGFLSGAIWGTLVAVAGLGTVSVLDSAENQRLADAVRDITGSAEDATAQTPAEPEAVEETAPATTVETAQPTPEAQSQTVETPEVDPETETSEVLESPDIADGEAEVDAPAGTVETTNPVAAPPVAEPVQGTRPAEIAGSAPNADAPLLDAPNVGTDATPAETMSAPLPTPQTGDEIAALADPAPTPEVGVDPGRVSSVPTTDLPAAPALAAPSGEVGLTVSTEPAQPPTPAVPQIDTPLVPAAETPSPEAAPGVATPDAPVAETDTTQPERPQVRRLVPEASAEAGDAPETTVIAARPSIGTPAGSLIDRDAGAAGRLPTIGTAEPEVEVDADVSVGTTPLRRFSAPVETDPANPRMSIVLIDDGSGPLGPDTLDTFPFPVTFALIPGRDGAAERMAAYRALGYEVAALVGVPEAAQPSDVEQILAGAVAALPEIVALVEAPGSALQGSRDATEQATAFAAESGHGLVFLPNGLNTAAAIAARENVPAVSVLRDFDGEGQDARTKRRFLDGAAFRARQDGQAIMLGRLTPDTVSALLLWSLQDRASSVAMVPVSDVLLGAQN